MDDKSLSEFLDQRDALIRAAERERCAKLIPTTWLDPLMSGKGISNVPWGCSEIEALLRGVRERILNADV